MEFLNEFFGFAFSLIKITIVAAVIVGVLFVVRGNRR
jgi:hypothetical protein